MIVTSHNLALLWENFDLQLKLGAILPELPKRVSISTSISLSFLIETRYLNLLSKKQTTWVPWTGRHNFNTLRMRRISTTHLFYIKMMTNCRYAWRQMVFFLSKLPKEEIDFFFAWAVELCGEQESTYKERLFRPLRYLLSFYSLYFY